MNLLGNIPLLDAKAATGVSLPIPVDNYKWITVAVTAAANTSLTFNFQGSIGKSLSSQDAPDFSAAQSVTNHWDYVGLYDIQNPATVIAGDTGVAIDNLAAAANTRLYQINVDALRWFSMSVTAYTDGAVTAWMIGGVER